MPRYETENFYVEHPVYWLLVATQYIFVAKSGGIPAEVDVERTIRTKGNDFVQYFVRGTHTEEQNAAPNDTVHQLAILRSDVGLRQGRRFAPGLVKYGGLLASRRREKCNSNFTFN